MSEEIRMTINEAKLARDGYYLHNLGGETFAEAFVREVKNDLIDISKSFFKIGFRLHEANRCGYYKELGYSSLVELAEDLFDFKHSTTYDLMQIWEYAHDPNSPMTMKTHFVKYSQSKLLEMSKSRNGENLIRHVAPSDSVKDIHDYITLLNAGKIKDYSIDSAKEYFKRYDRTSGLPLITEHTSEPASIEAIFQTSGKSEPAQPQVAPQPEPEPQPDNEKLIKKALLSKGPYGKFQIYDKYIELRPTTNYSEFSKFVKQQYGIGSSWNGDLDIDYSPKEFKLRTSLDKDYMRLTWTSVAYRIAELINTDEYLSDKEKAQHEEYKKQSETVQPPTSGVTINTAPDEEFFQTSGKTEPEQSNEIPSEEPKQITTRQYLERLPDEDFVEQFCTQVYIYTEFLSQHRIEKAKPKIIQWLRELRKEN